MTPSALVANLGLSLAALSALCLSLDRHHAAIFETKPGRWRVMALRAAGWLGIILSLLLGGWVDGWEFAPIQWIGALTGAGVILVLLLSYRPRIVCPVAVTALLAAATGTFLALSP